MGSKLWWFTIDDKSMHYRQTDRQTVTIHTHHLMDEELLINQNLESKIFLSSRNSYYVTESIKITSAK